MASQFGNGPWKPSESIWSNGRNVIGSTFSREVPGSRGSDEASPTTISGSAQLNHQSEAETPTWSRNGIWKQESTSQVRPSSGTASPSQTRDSLAQQSLQDSQPFQSRSAVGQNSNAFASLPKVHNGYGPSFGTANDNLDNGTAYPPLGSKFSFDGTSAFKRGSLGEFSGLGHGRENSIAGSRPNDFSSQTTPGSLNHDLPQYPFEAGSRGSISRPSGPHQSISFPTNGTSTRGLALDQGLSTLLSGSLNISDNHRGDVASNGYLNPQTRPFQFNPSSQTWNNERNFGQIYPQQDTHGDQIPNAYTQQGKRGSVERASPISLNFARNGVNSPRYTPGSRQDSWSQSRPISRGMSQDYERLSTTQFPQAPNSYYQGGAYYGNNFPQYSLPVQAYDIYGPNANYRGQMAAQFGMINQSMPPVSVPLRPGSRGDQDPGKGVRSVLLEEFRASNRSNKRWELKDIYGHVVEFSGDQHGSRFIQEKLQNANSDEKDQVFQEIKSNSLQLMKDVFGNYVIQKFFEHGSQVQKTILAREMKGKILELSLQMYACRVVQKALEHVLVEQQEEIVEELKPNLFNVLKDNNGNHVVQKIIQLVPQKSMPFVMELFRGQVQTLATHAFGCRIIQRMLEFGNPQEKEELMGEINVCAPQLITDTFGNYVAQHIIGKGDPEDKSFFINFIIDRLYEYSTHKFASNVVEKCVEFGTIEQRQTIMDKLLTPDSNGNYLIDRVMLDQYGNYVIQHIVGRLRGQDKVDLLKQMKQRFTALKRTVTSRQMGAIERLLEKNEKLLNSDNNESSPAPANKRNPAELQLDISSPANTPALTMENSSPRSNNSASSVKGKDVTDMTITNAKTSVDSTLQLEVVDADAEAN